ncbi:MAG TPA: ribonuclease J [Vicinamibacteria bacterium]|nr:ribonuclease J [Vicinamibacteria bacterium]
MSRREGDEAKPIRLVPLGGLGEFGLNALVLEWEDHLLLLDAGVLFPSADMPGVDSIVPDFDYLRERAAKVRGVLLTHGHEDHIGALAHALDAAPAPVYGSRLTLGFARKRLQERSVRAEMRTLVPGEAVEIGPFRVHPIRVAHSVLDSLALAIETPAGVVLASGDFKIDPHARPEERTDLETLSAWGDRGVLALLSDSTNVERPGLTGGENDVLPAFEDVLARTRGRVLVSCFATSIPRMQRVADLAARARRPVAFVGRRMVDNAEVALDLGLLRLDESARLPPAGLSEPAGHRAVVFVSGSQGEPLSALSMVSLGEHRDVAAGPGDTVVLSARAIPGNERTVSRLMSNLFRLGCDVVHPGTAKVHVSGHGSRGDLVELLRRVRPRYLVPVHGEYRMLAQHARLAAAAGLSADRVLVAEDGDVLSLSAAGARREARVAAGRLLLDRGGASEVEDLVVRDRRHLSSDGIVVPIVVVDRRTGHLESPPEIVSRGIVDTDEAASLAEEAGRLLAGAMDARPAEERLDSDLTRERVRDELRRFYKRRTQRRPMVIPVVMEV